MITLANRHFALRIHAQTGALVGLTHPGDAHAMNWVVEPGENAWAPLGSAWGLGWLAMAMPGIGPQRWQEVARVRHGARQVACTYRLPTVTLTVTRTLVADQMRERYRWRADRGQRVEIWGVGLNVPFNDSYPDAATCAVRRCNAHLWGGGSTAWACALRMGGGGPHLGLVGEGVSINGYAVQDRGALRSGSNIRGSLAFIQDGFTLEPGAVREFGWTMFWHQGWSDFARQQTAIQPLQISAGRYAGLVGAPVAVRSTGVRLEVDGKALRSRGGRATFTPTQAGEHAITAIDAAGRRSVARVLAVPPLATLIGARVRFIRERQQITGSGDLAGALVPYDCKLGVQALDRARPDCNEGRERLAMGVLLAQWGRLCGDRAAATAATLHGRFVRQHLQTADGAVRDGVGATPHRLYNFPWAVRLHLELHRLHGRARHLDDALLTAEAYYQAKGAGFYPVGMPLSALHAACLARRRVADAERVAAWATAHAERVAGNGLAFPPHEVRYEQSIVAPAVDILLQAHALDHDPRWINVARPMLVALEAFNGRQPHHRMHDIAIRHWDGFWFGARPQWGDVFPHYWTTATATVFSRWWQATGEVSYRDRARAILLANLSSFRPDGSATCAHIFPDHVDGEPGRRDDALANDQDWALVFLLDHAEADAGFSL